MRFENTLALMCALLCVLAVAAVRADFQAGCELQHTSSTKAFNCTILQQNFGQEYRLRIDVCYVDDPLDPQCESIVQRFNRTVASGYRVSSQMIIGEPWSPFRTCCQHDALGASNPPTVTPLVGESFSILRSDNFTRIVITSVDSVPTDLETQILKNWDNAEDVCNLKCITEADVVFNIDNSGSINSAEFTLMNAFVVSFVNAFTLSPTKTNLGIVLFGGDGNPSSTRRDEYWMPTIGKKSHLNESWTENLWNGAVGSTTWQEDFAWFNHTLDDDFYTDFLAPPAATPPGGQFGGIAFLELYMTPFKFEVLNVMERIGDGESRPGYLGWTAIGTGMMMARDLMYRNPNRPVSAEGEGNGFPRLLITMADGGNNHGISTANARSRILGIASGYSMTPNITLISIGVTSSVVVSEMHAAASDKDVDYFFVSSFDDFDSILTPLISGTCSAQSNNAIPCSDECAAAQGLCTACGTCIQCLRDDDCPSCSFCSALPFGTCSEDISAALATCTIESDCHSVTCDPTAPRATMCKYNYNDTALIDSNRDECLTGPNGANSVFNVETCKCVTTIGSGGDGTVSAAAVAAASGAGAIAILIVLAVLLALLLLLLLAAVFIIIAVVIAALVMLAFGVAMAVPPSINGLEVTAPTQVVNDENPLAVDGLEWVESAVTAAS